MNANKFITVKEINETLHVDITYPHEVIVTVHNYNKECEKRDVARKIYESLGMDRIENSDVGKDNEPLFSNDEA